VRHHIPAVRAPVHVFCVRGANGGVPALPRPDSPAGAPQMIAQNAHICRGRDLPIGVRDELPETALCRVNLQKCVRAIHCLWRHMQNMNSKIIFNFTELERSLNKHFSGCALFLLLFQKAFNFFYCIVFLWKVCSKITVRYSGPIFGYIISETYNL
jgi:hypothetical protein